MHNGNHSAKQAMVELIIMMVASAIWFTMSQNGSSDWK
jgi:hypothetical protein